MISAGVVELADTPDLGSGGRPCRFKSCHPHYLQQNQGFGAFSLDGEGALLLFLTSILTSVLVSKSKSGIDRTEEMAYY